MPDYLFLMESRLHPEQWRIVLQVQEAAKELGMNLYLVGGAVRDLIGGFPLEDLDFVVEGKALKLVRQLTRRQARVVWKSDALKAAELEFPHGMLLSVSMARAGNGLRKSRSRARPGSILDDLRSRDYSVNAIGISLNPHSRGLLLDPTNGVADMEKKELRALQPGSFLRDPIRLFRGTRFRTRLKYKFEPKTAAQYQEAKDAKLLEKITPEDLQKEFRRIGRDYDPEEILRALQEEGLLTVLHPKLQGPRLDWAAMARATNAAQMLAVAGLPVRSFPLFLYLLTHKLSPRDRNAAVKRLCLEPQDSNDFRKLPAAAKRLAMNVGGQPDSTPAKLYQLLSAARPELILLVLLAYRTAKVSARVRNYLRKYLPMRSKLPDTELQALGIAAGTPRYERIREQFFQAMLERKVRTRSDYSRLLKKFVQSGK